MVHWPWAKTNAIHEAVAWNDVVKLKQLLGNKCANVNAENADGATALHMAAAIGDSAALKALLAHANIDPNPQETYGKTPLHLAISERHLSAVQILVEDPRTDVNLADYNGRSPLHYFVDFWGTCEQSDRRPLFRILERAPGLNYNAQDKHQRTALGWALGCRESSYCGERLVATLTSHREAASEVALTDVGGNTELHRAARHIDSPMALLVEGHDKALLDAKNKFSETALHVAGRSRNWAALKPLVYAGASLDVRDSNHATPLHIGVQHSSYEFVESLPVGSSLGRIIFTRDNDGNTPLHLAAKRGDSEMMTSIFNLVKRMEEMGGPHQVLTRSATL